MGASFLADNGASLTMIKSAGGWKSSSACEGYIEDSLLSKRKVGETMGINVVDKKKVFVGDRFPPMGVGKENVPPESTVPVYKNCTFFVAGNGASSAAASAGESFSSVPASSSSLYDSDEDDDAVPDMIGEEEVCMKLNLSRK